MFGLFNILACQSMSDLELRIYGESFIEEGIPQADMSDGWEITFSEFWVGVDQIAVDNEVLLETSWTDLTLTSNGEGQRLLNTEVSVDAIESLEFQLTEVNVVGTATHSDTNRAKNFDWSFEVDQVYRDCEGVEDLKDGQMTTFEITIHSDHLFYDSLVAEEPDLRFEILSNADLNEDDTITFDELAMVDVGTYDIGNYDVENLLDWINVQVTTLVHSNGEGHCQMFNAL